MGGQRVCWAASSGPRLWSEGAEGSGRAAEPELRPREAHPQTASRGQGGRPACGRSAGTVAAWMLEGRLQTTWAAPGSVEGEGEDSRGAEADTGGPPPEPGEAEGGLAERNWLMEVCKLTTLQPAAGLSSGWPAGQRGRGLRLPNNRYIQEKSNHTSFLMLYAHIYTICPKISRYLLLQHSKSPPFCSSNSSLYWEGRRARTLLGGSNSSQRSSVDLLL